MQKEGLPGLLSGSQTGWALHSALEVEEATSWNISPTAWWLVQSSSIIPGKDEKGWWQSSQVLWRFTKQDWKHQYSAPFGPWIRMDEGTPSKTFAARRLLAAWVSVASAASSLGVCIMIHRRPLAHGCMVLGDCKISQKISETMNKLESILSSGLSTRSGGTRAVTLQELHVGMILLARHQLLLISLYSNLISSYFFVFGHYGRHFSIYHTRNPPYLSVWRVCVCAPGHSFQLAPAARAVQLEHQRSPPMAPGVKKSWNKMNYVICIWCTCVLCNIIHVNIWLYEIIRVYVIVYIYIYVCLYNYMIWYDTIRYNTIRYDDMIWYDTILWWYDMIWYDMIWCDVIWYDMIWYDMTWYDMGIWPIHLKIDRRWQKVLKHMFAVPVCSPANAIRLKLGRSCAAENDFKISILSISPFRAFSHVLAP